MEQYHIIHSMKDGSQVEDIKEYPIIITEETKEKIQELKKKFLAYQKALEKQKEKYIENHN